MSDDPTSPFYDPFNGFTQVQEAPSSLDRSSVESIESDEDTIEVGETIRVKYLDNPGYTGPLYVSPPSQPNANLGNIEETWRLLGNADLELRWSHSEPGVYTVRAPASATADSTSAILDQYRVVSGDGNAGDETTGSPDDWTNTDDFAPSPSDLATSHPLVVPADNDEGAAPAPVLRRQGVELGPNGATFRFPNGDSVDVGAIEEADEVARYVDGENAGEVVDADEPATDPDSTSGTDATTSTGDLGPAAAVVALLGLGYAATQR